MKRILCIGDACADIVIPFGSVRQGRDAAPSFMPGGTVANTASGLGRLGVACSFLGKAGRDYYGRGMKEALERDGVDTTRFTLREELASVQILVVIDEANERFPFLMPREAPSHLALFPEDLPETLLEQFDMVHTSGLMLFEDPAASSVCGFLEKCSRAGVPVSLDINLRVETLEKDRRHLYRAMDCAAYLLGSAADELMPLTGCGDAESAARCLVTEKRTVVSRLGAEGACVYTPTETFRCGGYPVRVADTLGAGDCYNSGFLYALTKGWGLARANRCGCAAAALNLTKPGARNGPTEEELSAFMKEDLKREVDA